MKKGNTDSVLENASTFAVIPTVDVVVFPHMVVPLLVLDPKIILGVREALEKENKQVILVATQPQASDFENENTPISIDDLYKVGTIGEVIRVMDLPEGGMKILVQGRSKARVNDLITTDDTLQAIVTPLEEETVESSNERFVQLTKEIVDLVERLPASNTTFSPDFPVILSQIEDPYKISDFILSHLNLSVDHAQKLLEKPSLTQVLEDVSLHLEQIITSSEVEESIRTSTRDSINKSQREYYLREQLRAIQKELGDDSESEVEEFEKQADAMKLDEEVKTEVFRQIGRLRKTSPDSLEATVLRNHIEWLLSMPWDKQTNDNNSINVAKETLDEGHFGLEDVKERILDYLSVKYLKQDCDSPILCLAGPPGTGKTSLGQSIAQAMGREFSRIALGGVHDESELRGHRRTYVGALPGRIVQALKKAGSMNPVLLLDEVDKLGSSHKGDPSAALLEVLDPEQNKTFYDNYLGVNIDLSKALFICTANDLSTIPGPLRDRMEIIEVSGYTQNEKINIAQKHLAPKIIKGSGLADTDISFSKEVLSELITGYTREAGVRTLSKMLKKLCAKYARSYIENKDGITFTPHNIKEHIGPRRASENEVLGRNKLGVTNGLAWTPFGGEVLQVEAILMPGTGKLILTGKLGDVMKESARAAVSYARSHAAEFNVDPKMFTDYDLHIHLPAGSIPKDGPSAGVTLLSSIFSVYTGREINGSYAMTGELNLQGNVLAIGGVKEKLLAAKQRGLANVLFPKQNEKDVKNLKDIPSGITISFVESVDEVLERVLLPK